eukprot:scaffold7710_cov63-Phaeocystis_antarctica.AAC.8
MHALHARTGALRAAGQEPGHLPDAASVDLPRLVLAHREARSADYDPSLLGRRVRSGARTARRRHLARTSRRAAAH